MGGERLVAFGIFDQRLLRFRHEADELGLDPFEAGLQLRIDRLVPGGIDRIDLPQNIDALARERMGAAVAIVLRDGEAIFLVLQLLEEFQAPPPADPGGVEIARAGKVGGAFLRAGKGEEAAHRRLLAKAHDAHARFRPARGDRGRAEHQAQQRDAGRVLDPLARADDMAALDMAQLMGDDALQLVHIVRLRDQAAMHPDILAARDEGVDFRIIDDEDLDIVGRHAGRLDQRRGHVGHEGFGLRVAQDLLRDRRARHQREGRQRQRQELQQSGHCGQAMP